VRARDFALTAQLLDCLFSVLRARQRCHESDGIVDFWLGQGERTERGICRSAPLQ
jgi:hypothetical protein